MPGGTDQFDASNNLVHAFMKFRRMGMSKGSRTIGDKVFPNGMRHSEVMLLFALKEMECKFPNGISVSDLSNNLNVKSPTITPIIGSLEKKNMLERSMDPNDRRIVRIRLKEAGNRFIEKGAQHFTDYIEGLVNYLGEEKSNTLAELMNEVYDYFSAAHH